MSANLGDGKVRLGGATPGDGISLGDGISNGDVVRVRIPTMRDVPAPEEFNVPGYECLDEVLSRAYTQAARGKGAERHARNSEPFTDQVILEGAARFGVGALLFQAFKKSEESQRLKSAPAVKELLGAIVYLAAAVIERERLDALEPDGS